MTRHQPAHWVGGDVINVLVITPNNPSNTTDLYWCKCDWLTEGELSVMVHNQLYAKMFEAADQSGMMLTAVQIYDEWWDATMRT